MTGVQYIWTSEDEMILGGLVSAAAATAVTAVKVNLSFGELKIFQKVQHFNNLRSMSYIFTVWKKNWNKLKEEVTETAISKTTKNSERYKLSP